MKKFLSALLSLMLCASVTVTNPPFEIFNPPQEEQYDDGNVVNPCEDSEHPSWGGDL